MSRSLSMWARAGLLAALGALVPTSALAGPQDKTATTLAERALRLDLTKAFNRKRALDMIAFGTRACGPRCGDEAKAQLAMAKGVVLANGEDDEGAQAAFDEARDADPEVELPELHRDGPAAPLFTPEEPEPTPEEPEEPEEPKEPPPPKPVASKDDDPGPPSEPLPVNVDLGLEVSGYIDNNAVEVITPGFLFSIEDPVDGWGINGSLLFDVVTAASPDIVSMASPKWQDERVAPAIGAHFKVDNWDFSFGGNLSIESDYLAYGGNVGIAVELANKQVTPSLGYSYGHDISGRANTPFDVYRLDLDRHGIIGGITFVLDKATVFSPGFTYVFETGEQHKPYRYLPLFDSAGPEIEKSASIDTVNASRLPARVGERLPTERHRFAVSALLAHRFKGVTLRITERLYRDTWQQMATTTDVRIPWDVADWLRIWPHLRFHAQNGTVFWQRAYRVPVGQGPDGTPIIITPNYRSGDREHGPLLGATGGLGFRFELHETVGLTVNGDVIYTRFLDHLYTPDRIGGFGVVVLDTELR